MQYLAEVRMRFLSIQSLRTHLALCIWRRQMTTGVELVARVGGV